MLFRSMARCNQRSGLHVQLICGRPEPFSDPEKTRGILSGVQNYFLFAGPRELEDLEEKCGYWGEELILTAVSMGLGTCWVGGTYDRRACQARLEPGETLVCAAALGIPEGSPAPRALRPAGELALPADCAPAWFGAGIAAVQQAPSAMNRQGYRFQLQIGRAHV